MTSKVLLSVDGVNVRFGGIQALSDVSFTVARGECTALIGPNGAGKTTLLNAIAGTVTPASGRIFFRGECLAGMPPHRVNARGIGRTFQGGEVIRALTVHENVMCGGVAARNPRWLPTLVNLGSVREGRRRLEACADELLDLVGLSEHAQRPAGTLPAGQQRLLGIARALATDALLLILDEPGAGLNEVEKVHLVDVIRSLSRIGKTVMFIEHDMDVVATLAARIIVLDRGRLIADGPPDIVRSDPQVIAAYLGTAPPANGAPRRGRPVSGPPLLRVSDLTVRYDGVAALDRVRLDVLPGEIVALVGANGAGKSTLLKAIARVVDSQAGSIHFREGAITSAKTDHVVQAGVALVPEGRELFPSLSVLDNLLVGRFPQLRRRGWTHVVRWGGAADEATARRLKAIHALFPVLDERRDQLAGSLSGGEAQMLAIGRALMAEPLLLMLDEPSLGIAPQVLGDIMRALAELREQGMTILLVEQNAHAALQIADRGYVLAAGRVVASGNAGSLLSDIDMLNAYLGNVAGPPRRPAMRLVG